MLVQTSKDSQVIESLLNAKSIAIVGASADRKKMGALPLQFLKKYGYEGKIYPIHPKAQEIEGWKCYSSISKVSDPIDLMVIAIASERIPELLRECTPGQINAALILSSGYAEVGDEGVQRQEELKALAAEKGIRLIGPNSVGVANLWNNNVPTISQVFDQSGFEPGPVAFVTQSGALGTAITAMAQDEGVKLGSFISTGNEVDLEFSDFCQYFIQDPNIKIIAGYVEGIRDGEKFKKVAREACLAGKPIILLKVGRTEVGNKAAQSHTGALAGSDDIYEAIFEEYGVVRAESIEELLDYLKIFSCYAPRENNPSNHVAVLSHSGGAGVIMADTCVTEDLNMPETSPRLKERLEERLPSFAALQNPIDMTASVVFKPDTMSDTVFDVIRSNEYDAAMLCVNLIWRQGDALADEILKAMKESEGILALAWIAGPEEPIKRLNKNGVPVYSDPVKCAKAVSAKIKWDMARQEIKKKEVVVPEHSQQKARSLRTFKEQSQLLEEYKIPMPKAELCQSADKAVEAAEKLGYPLAMKIIAEGLLHKSDIGGVEIGVESAEQVREVFRRFEEINADNMEGVLLQKMVSGGVELFAGMKRDEVFGPVIVFGLGGIYVEILKETTLIPAPFSKSQAMDIIRSSSFFPLLDGARGREKCDVDSLANILSQLSILSVQEGVEAIDLNPIIVTPQEAVVVDYKFENNAKNRGQNIG